MAPTESLSRKIRWIFMVQGLVASLIVTLGTVYGSLFLRDMLLKQRLIDEAQQVWQVIEHDAQVKLPGTSGISTFYVPTGEMPDDVPPALRSLTPGLHAIDDGKWRLTYVSRRAEGTLYVRAAPGLTDHLVRWISLLAILLSVAGIALISWLGYRRCKRIVTPVAQLTESVLSWDPMKRQPSAFETSSPRGEGTYEVAHLGEALSRMSQRVDDYIDRERNFTRDASHELRTPVTVVRMAGDLLSNETLSPRGERSLRRIQQATGDLETLIDAFLVLARHPDIPVDIDDVRVQDILHEEVATAQESLEGKDVTLTVQATADPTVHAPPRVLAVVLRQLLRNACHFTHEGSVRVELLADRVEISDTGIGMDEEALARAFDPFWRAEISDHTAKGMGLTIAQRLADRFGWQILLQSEPGHGTLAVLKFA